MGPATRVCSPAKINLTLEIVGKRTDGYHELRTVFQTVGLSDTLSFDWGGAGIVFTCDDPAVPAGEENLAVRAARLVERHAGSPVAVRIALVKKIPMGAGLGGGSSNAAAVLQVLGEQLGIPREKIHAMAAGLGADVPFFLAGGTALGSGKGERLESLPPFPSYPVVIVKPRFSISTAQAYARVRDYSSGEKSGELVFAIRSGDAAAAFRSLTNDFERFLFPIYPDLEKIKKAFLDAGALAAQLSGSGSALFAFASDSSHAGELARAVSRFGTVWLTAS